MTLSTILLPQPLGRRLTGTEISTALLSSGNDRFKREVMVERWVDDGNIPSFMSNFVGIDIVGSSGTLTIFVSPDVLCLGVDNDYVRVPLFPATYQRIFDKIGCILPTTKIVNDVWNAATVKLDPLSWGPPYDASMMASSRIVEHNRRINEKLNVLYPNYVLGQLITGHKKDVVITQEMLYDSAHVWIYGWHQRTGKAIQRLYGQHEATYCDYSHSARMILRWGTLTAVDGTVSTVDLVDIFADPILYKFVCSPCPLTSWHYPCDA